MRLSSYGLGKESSGAVHLLGDIPTDLAGRRVLLVDDITDTRRSIAYAAALLHRRGIGDLWNCALLDKPEPREVEVEIDFVGFSIGDVFVAGYSTTTRRSTAICPRLTSSSDADDARHTRCAASSLRVSCLFGPVSL